MKNTLSKSFAAAAAFLFVTTASAQASEAGLKDYMTGEVKHLAVVHDDVNFHDVLVKTAAGTDGQRAERLGAKKGKVLLVTFWSQQCLLCRSHMKELAKLQAEVGKDSIEVVAINLDRSPIGRIRTILDKRGLDVLTAYQDFNGNIPARLKNDPSIRLNGHEPKTLIVGPEGKVRAVANERKDWSTPEAKALLNALAAGKV